MGRAPKPLELLKLEGGFRRDRHGNRVDVEVTGVPIKPEGLSDRESELWDQHVPLLAESGVVGFIDTPLLRAWCEWQSLAEQTLSASMKKPTDARLLRLARQSHETAFAIAQRFGMDPLSRQRLNGRRKSASTAERFLK